MQEAHVWSQVQGTRSHMLQLRVCLPQLRSSQISFNLNKFQRYSMMAVAANAVHSSLDSCTPHNSKSELWPAPPHCSPPGLFTRGANHEKEERDKIKQSYGFSSSHVWLWELDYKKGWALKNGSFWIVVLEKTLESHLDSKEIKSVNPKENQPLIFVGRTDAEAETPVLWPPHAKSWLIGKDPDAWKDWGQEEKGTTEDEMIGWHHWLNGREFG